MFPRIGLSAGDWRALLQYQAATYAICIGGAAALVPLNLHMKDAPEESVRGRVLGVSGLAMLRSPTLYLLGSVFLLHSLGQLPTKDEINVPIALSAFRDKCELPMLPASSLLMS